MATEYNGPVIPEEYTGPIVPDSPPQSQQGSARKFGTPDGRLFPPEKQHIRDLARNSVVEGLAGVPDMFLNAPTNLWNLGKAAFGSAAIASGHPNLAPDITPTPNLALRGANAAGLTVPNVEPQNTKERLIAAALRAGSGMALAPGAAIPNMAAGAASGAVGQGVSDITGSPMAGMAASLATPFAMQGGGNWARGKIADTNARQQANSVEDATLTDARNAGFKIPVSMVDPGGVRGYINDRLESFGGKAAIKNTASLNNAEIRKQLAAKELQMPPETALTIMKLDEYRNRESVPYRDVSSLPTMQPVRTMVNTNPNRNAYPILTPQQSAAEALRDLKQARYDANNKWMEYNKVGGGEVSVLEQAKALSQKVDALEQHLQNTAIAAGKPELADALSSARTKIAKSYDVEQALNQGDANISGAPFAAKLKAQRPLTGWLDLIGRTQQAFPQVMAEGQRLQSSGVSNTDMMTSAALGAIGHATFGLPGTAAAVAPFIVPAARSGARALTANPTYQQLMARSYEPSIISKILEKTTTNPKDTAYRAALISALKMQQAGEQQ